MTAPTGVVARWSSRRTSDRPQTCEECGEAVPAATVQCPQCRQFTPAHPTGMLAVVIDTASGRRLVIAERTPAGGWAPTRDLPATSEAVRVLRRQDATGSVA
jgi:RNA polymerase subunit RPABC4/transcription elongation factor Spt4